MITSLTNEKMKEYAKLNQSKYREEKGLFIVETRSERRLWNRL